MPKFVMIIVAIIVVSVSMCYTANRICNTIDKRAGGLSNEHEVLMKDHEALMGVANETRITVKDTNEKITFLYNMVKNQNPDLKSTIERNN